MLKFLRCLWFVTFAGPCELPILEVARAGCLTLYFNNRTAAVLAAWNGLPKPTVESPDLTYGKTPSGFRNATIVSYTNKFHCAHFSN